MSPAPMENYFMFIIAYTAIVDFGKKDLRKLQVNENRHTVDTRLPLGSLFYIAPSGVWLLLSFTSGGVDSINRKIKYAQFRRNRKRLAQIMEKRRRNKSLLSPRGMETLDALSYESQLQKEKVCCRRTS